VTDIGDGAVAVGHVSRFTTSRGCCKSALMQ
jgi:hypothetical protein